MIGGHFTILNIIREISYFLSSNYHSSLTALPYPRQKQNRVEISIKLKLRSITAKLSALKMYSINSTSKVTPNKRYFDELLRQTGKICRLNIRSWLTNINDVSALGEGILN